LQLQAANGKVNIVILFGISLGKATGAFTKVNAPVGLIIEVYTYLRFLAFFSSSFLSIFSCLLAFKSFEGLFKFLPLAMIFLFILFYPHRPESMPMASNGRRYSIVQIVMCSMNGKAGTLAGALNPER